MLKNPVQHVLFPAPQVPAVEKDILPMQREEPQVQPELNQVPEAAVQIVRNKDYTAAEWAKLYSNHLMESALVSPKPVEDTASIPVEKQDSPIPSDLSTKDNNVTPASPPKPAATPQYWFATMWDTVNRENPMSRPKEDTTLILRDNIVAVRGADDKPYFYQVVDEIGSTGVKLANRTVSRRTYEIASIPETIDRSLMVYRNVPHTKKDGKFIITKTTQIDIMRRVIINKRDSTKKRRDSSPKRTPAAKEQEHPEPNQVLEVVKEMDKLMDPALMLPALPPTPMKETSRSRDSSPKRTPSPEQAMDNNLPLEHVPASQPSVQSVESTQAPVAEEDLSVTRPIAKNAIIGVWGTNNKVIFYRIVDELEPTGERLFCFWETNNYDTKYPAVVERIDRHTILHRNVRFTKSPDKWYYTLNREDIKECRQRLQLSKLEAKKVKEAQSDKKKKAADSVDETSPGSIVAIWGKYNKALYYKIVQEEPLLGQFLFLWGGQRYYDGETPSIEPIDYETIVYFNVPHAVVNGKYLIKKKTRDQVKRLIRDSQYDIDDE